MDLRLVYFSNAKNNKNFIINPYGKLIFKLIEKRTKREVNLRVLSLPPHLVEEWGVGGGGHQPPPRLVGWTALSFASAHTTQDQTIPDSIFFPCFFLFLRRTFLHQVTTCAS